MYEILAAAVIHYTVRSGDNLSTIGARYGTAYQAIAAGNRIANPDLIFPGQRLVFRAGDRTVTAAYVPAAAGSYGHPYSCGDGDGDGWDMPCSQLHRSGAQAAPARSYHPAPQRRAATRSGGVGYIPGVTAPGLPGTRSGIDWAGIAQCESSGNWSANTGNGFSGGLQFTPSTWAAYGGGQYAASASQASPGQQIAVAQRVLQGQGIGAWPVCGKRG